MIKKIVITVLMVSIVAIGGSLAYSYGKRSAEQSLKQKMAQQAGPQEASGPMPEAQSLQKAEPEQERGIPVKVATVTQEDIQLSQTFYAR